MSDSLHSLPPLFIENIRTQLGNETESFLKTYLEPHTRGIRFRGTNTPVPAEDLLGKIPYVPNAYYLSNESRVGTTILHDAGAFYIQEPSAMAAAAVLAPKPTDTVLDLCAAPGGKSTQIAISFHPALLVSNEPIPSRAQILSSNIERMGIKNGIVTSAYPDQLRQKWPSFFDRILVDAPCSGEGMFRKDPQVRLEWTESSPAHCAGRQADILDAAADMLKPGGTLVYSTCTFNILENDQTISAFLSRHSDFSLMPFSLS